MDKNKLLLPHYEYNMSYKVGIPYKKNI